MSSTKTKTKTTVKLSLAFFDLSFDGEQPFRLKASVPLKKWRPLAAGDYKPRGSTPLLDATGHMIHHLDGARRDDEVQVGILVDESGSMGGNVAAVIDGVNEFVHSLTTVKKIDTKTAGKVICVIFTDGMENASRELDSAAVAKLIADREAQGWTFIYMGANQDAWATGMSFGLSGGASGQMVNLTSSAVGTASAFRLASSDTVDYLSDNDSYVQARTTTSKRTVTEDGTEVTS